MDQRFPYSPAGAAKVRRVRFGILSPDEIRQMSVAEIQHGETTVEGKPKTGGLSDPRLGTIDPPTARQPPSTAPHPHPSILQPYTTLRGPTSPGYSSTYSPPSPN